MSDCFPGHVDIDSSGECSSACISQLHRTDLFSKTYWCLGILIGYSWLSLHITYLVLGQFASIILFPPLKLMVSHLFCYNGIETHNFL